MKEDSNVDSEQDTGDENSGDDGGHEEGFVEGMDQSGFIGDNKCLKPLTPEAFAGSSWGHLYL
jgi:hypothetical protein